MSRADPGRRLLERRFPARPGTVAEARWTLDELAEALDPARLEDLRLLLSELVSNAIRHGPAGEDPEVEVDVLLRGDTIRVEVRDPGNGFTPPEPGGQQIGGWGLMLVDRIADRWGVDPEGPTRVWFELDGASRRAMPESAWPSALDTGLLDGLGAAVVAADLEGVITRWNRHAEVLFGLRSVDAIGRTLAELLTDPNDREAAERALRRIKEGRSLDGEWRAPRADGSRIWVWAATTPVRDDRGVVLGLLATLFDITQRKRAQSALSGSEERLRIALAAGRMGTWDWDVRVGRVRWSPSLEEIHGLAPGTFGGRFEDFQRDIHPEDRPGVLAAVERAVNRGEEYALDYRIVRPDGATRWLAVRGSVLRDDAGRAMRMAGVCADITERKEAERALRVQFAVSRALGQAVTVEDVATEVVRAICESMGWELGLLWRVDGSADVLQCVDGWRTPTSAAGDFLSSSRGYTFARGSGLMGRVWDTGQTFWIPDVTRDVDFPRASLVVRVGLHAALAFPITLRGHVLGAVECLSARIREPDEALLQVMGNIGAQIGHFLERIEAEEQVAESEARKSAILEAALEAIITIDEHGVIVELNRAAGEMFGLDVDEVVGRPLAELIIPERYRARHRDALERVRRSGRGAAVRRRMEVSGRRTDGTEFPLELTITGVDLPEPEPAMFTGYLRDLTPSRRVEELQARLLENERIAREQLTASHERMTFLADASMVLGSSLDHRKTLAKVARLSIPHLADWCAVDLQDPDGSIHPVVVAHVDPDLTGPAREYRHRYRPDPDDHEGVSAVIRTGRPELYPVITDGMLEERVTDPERRAMLRRIGLRSAMIVPLEARGRVLGAITFAAVGSGRAFGEADLELAQDLAQRAALAIDNARLYEERSHIARTLQRTLLPRRLPEIPGVEIAAFYQPAGVTQTEVGGDFYDVFGSIDGSWDLVIGDVCGKGVEAAALTGLARHTLRTAATREPRPSDALVRLNEALVQEGGDRFCTVALGRIGILDGGARLTVSSGGHPMPLILRREGRIETVGAPGSLLGVFEDVRLKDRSTRLGPGDTVVFFTDGFVDPRHPKPIAEEAFRALLLTCVDLDAQQTADCLGDAIADPGGEAPDDVALLVIRVSP